MASGMCLALIQLESRSLQGAPDSTGLNQELDNCMVVVSYGYI